jgi:hypothetical protein
MSAAGTDVGGPVEHAGERPGRVIQPDEGAGRGARRHAGRPGPGRGGGETAEASAAWGNCAPYDVPGRFADETPLPVIAREVVNPFT